MRGTGGLQGIGEVLHHRVVGGDPGREGGNHYEQQGHQYPGQGHRVAQQVTEHPQAAFVQCVKAGSWRLVGRPLSG
ncbi:hypothetical protein D3C81_2177830 [compost metagenome]